MARRKHQDPPLPKQWPERARRAVINAMSLVHIAMAAGFGRGANHRNALHRARAENKRLEQEIRLLLEERRIKNARMQRVPAQERPHYSPMERLAILEIRALRGWSLRQTAECFMLSTTSVSSWMRRLDVKGSDGFLEPQAPANKYPAFVTFIVQRLKLYCPNFGGMKIAQCFARNGLVL